jgi:hypothetical protein
VIRTLGEPIGNTDLGVYGAPTHGNAGQLAVGNDFLEAKLRVAEHGDDSDEHGDPSGMWSGFNVRSLPDHEPGKANVKS